MLEIRGSTNPAGSKMQVRSNLQLLTSFRWYRPGTSLTDQTGDIPDTVSQWQAQAKGAGAAGPGGWKLEAGGWKEPEASEEGEIHRSGVMHRSP